MRRTSWFVALVLLLFLISRPLFACQPREAKRVLVLHGEAKDNPGEEMIEQGIQRL